MRLTALLLASVLARGILAGHAGIHNGAIQGVVYDDFNQPLGGVSVAAVRSENPPIIRTAVTDARGNYFLGDLPMGTYTLGFQKFGFQPITTEAGTPGNQTAVGRQIRVFVDSGQTVVAPAVNLSSVPVAANAAVSLTLQDGITADPVSHATVVVGSTVVTGGSAGRYQLSVIPSFDPQSGQPRPLSVRVLADGYQELATAITVVSSGQHRFTFNLAPEGVTLAGRLLTPGAPPGFNFAELGIVVPNVGSEFLAATINPNGSYSLRVPASNSTLTRTFQVQFFFRGQMVGQLTGIVAPRTGSRTLPDVTIRLPTVSVQGQVFLSSGQPADGSGPIDQAVIVQLGRASSIMGGRFTFTAVPVGQPLTLKVSVQNPTTRQLETGQAEFRPLSDGSANPVFEIPPIVTRPGQ